MLEGKLPTPTFASGGGVVMQEDNVQQDTVQQDDSAQERRTNVISERIIATATGLFETQGVARTYISDIMRGESLTRELFYYYFTDKAELVKCVIEAYRERCYAAILEAVEAAGDSIEARLQAATQTIIELFYDEDCEHTAMARVFDELKMFRQMMGDLARFGAECAYGADADAEVLRKNAVLLLACVGMVAVFDGDRDLCLGQAKRMITHVLSLH